MKGKTLRKAKREVCPFKAIIYHPPGLPESLKKYSAFLKVYGGFKKDVEVLKTNADIKPIREIKFATAEELLEFINNFYN